MSCYVIYLTPASLSPINIKSSQSFELWRSGCEFMPRIALFSEFFKIAAVFKNVLSPPRLIHKSTSAASESLISSSDLTTTSNPATVSSDFYIPSAVL